ncbi:MAG: SDR family NAD(P)-dependent oxidoreductase [Pseudomonadota bacterium]
MAASLSRRLQAKGKSVDQGEAGQEGGELVIFLQGLASDPGHRASLDLHKQAFLAARAMAGRLKPGDAFVTVQDSGGDLGFGGASPGKAWRSGMPGLVKTAAREWPGVDLKAIDIATESRDAEAIAELVMQELFAGGPDMEVAYDVSGRRLVPVLRSRPLGLVHDLPLRDDDVVLISGGARGVTAAAAVALAEKKRLRLCLLGRSAVHPEPAGLESARDEVALRRLLIGRATAAGLRPDLPAIRRETSRILAAREIVQTLERIRALGSDALYLSCDVTSAADVAVAVGEVHRTWGPVAGLVHGAGVIADKSIADKGDADFEMVFRTKVDGWANLLGAIDADRLRLVCNFSSVSAKFGNFGQCDYAIANEILNKQAIAFARAHPGCRVKSICWGPWEGGMVDAALKRHFERQGVGMIDLPSGALAFVEEMSSADGAVEVILRNGTFISDDGSRMTVEVDERQYGYLVDHSIAAAPVVPMVLVLEWFLRAARTQWPDASALALRDLHVQKGIVLDGFPVRSYRFDIEVAADRQAGELRLQLKDEQGRVRYEARVGPGDPETPGDPAPPAAFRPATVYGDGRLFHGPAFQTIRDIGAFGSDGVQAVLATTSDRSWPRERWLSDPAALDGGLQLARLWVLEQGGGPTLPMGLQACQVLRVARPGETYRCRLRTERVDALRSRHDLDLWLGDELAVSVRGLEMYRTRDMVKPVAVATTAA